MALPPKSGEPPVPIPAAPRELHRDDYIVILFDERLAMVRLVRSALPFPDLATVERVYDAISQVLDRLGRPGKTLLSDVRAAPGRNDLGFETLMHKLRPRMQHGFDRTGIWVSTAVGAMQVRRIAKEEGTERSISTDEAALLRYLTGPPAATK